MEGQEVSSISGLLTKGVSFLIPTSTSPFKILELPAELRLKVYRILFTEATLEPDCTTLTVESFSTIKTVKKVKNKQAALLLASRFFFDEGLPTLASNTTVRILGNHDFSDRNDLLNKISNDFMRHVQDLHLPTTTLIRSDRSVLSRLKKITLAEELNGGHPVTVLHELVCRYCGKLDSSHVYNEFMWLTKDWEWKRKQLMHLGKENGWEVTFMIYFGRWRNEQMFPHQFEFDFDLETEELLHKRVVKSGETMMKDHDFEDIVQVGRLWDDLGCTDPSAH